MNRWVQVGVLLCGGLAACAGSKQEQRAETAATASGEQAAMVPSASVGAEADSSGLGAGANVGGAGAGAEVGTSGAAMGAQAGSAGASASAGKTSESRSSAELLQPDFSTSRQPVAGKEVEGGLRLTEKGQFCKPTGQVRTEHGRWFQPEGTYGKTGTFGTEGQVGVRGTYGTYVKPEGTYTTTERVFVNPEGNYVMPKGATEPIVRAPGEPLTIETERQPVAGREGKGELPGLLITDQKGRSWAITNADVVRNVEQKLQSEGYNPGAVDGVADQQLASAILKFQSAHQLKPTGALNRETANAMGLTWDELLSKSQPPAAMPPAK